jgi:hypothetical protein
MNTRLLPDDEADDAFGGFASLGPLEPIVHSGHVNVADIEIGA